MPKQSASDFFDQYAHDFSAIYGTENTLRNRLINKFLRKSMRLRYEKTIRECSPIEGKSVLDVGCGPGHYGLMLARRGISSAYGIDFAPGMIELAKRNAADAGFQDRCNFILDDFMKYEFDRSFDYCILMGFMDYVESPRPVIEKALSLTNDKAFFSFPAAKGFLAWQRRVRYRKKCDLFMYRRNQFERLFTNLPCLRIEVNKLSRDYFVIAYMK
jgi:2-polyprenyl-3-methyl-5-hydroxy-6-metoxy-1,4-benzoquinol methylase